MDFTFAIKDWHFTGTKLGSGANSIVYLVQHKHSCMLAAMKVIDLRNAHHYAELIQLAERESAIHRSIVHPNIIRLYDSFEHSGKWIFIMELATKGTLYDYILQNHVPENVIKNWFTKIASAVEYCHGRGIVHRDLKLENILFTDTNEIKLCDFGLSNIIHTESDQLNTCCGSPTYAAPELFMDLPYAGPPVDIWALGIILYSMLFNKFPWKSIEGGESLVKEITSGAFVIPHHSATPLLYSMLRVNPSLRIVIRHVIQHPWLKSTECGVYNGYINIPTSVIVPKFGIARNEPSDPDDIQQHTLAHQRYSMKRTVSTLTHSVSSLRSGSDSRIEDPPVPVISVGSSISHGSGIAVPRITIPDTSAKTPRSNSDPHRKTRVAHNTLSNSDPNRYNTQESPRNTDTIDSPRTAKKNRKFNLLRRLLHIS